MSEVNNGIDQLIETPEAPAAANTIQQAAPSGKPAKGSPEYKAQMAARAPASVPAKFKNQDGSVDVAKLTQAYQELERKNTQDSQEAAVTPPIAAATASGKPEGISIDDVFNTQSKPATDAWKLAQTELSTTKQLSAETKESLKKAYNATDEMIDGMIAGFQAQRLELGRRLADAVGGQDKLTKVIEHAKVTMKPEQLQQLRVDLEGPNGALIIKGLLYTMPAAAAPTSASGVPASTLNLAPGNAPPSITGFRSQTELLAAFNDPKYKSGDPAFRELVARRMIATQRAQGR